MSQNETTRRELRPIHAGWLVLILSCILTFVPPMRDTGLFLMPFTVGYIIGCANDN